MTTDGLRDLFTGLDSAALTAAGLSVDEVRAAEAARAGLYAGTLSATRIDGSRHLTASCLLLAPHGPSWSVALALHAASGQWRQFGGHLELSDQTLRDAAVRELTEESCIDMAAAGVRVSTSPIAVREFSVGTTACLSHLDVLYAAIIDGTRPLATADPGVAEVAWWRSGDLPTDAADDLQRDLPLLLKRAERSHQASETGAGN